MLQPTISNQLKVTIEDVPIPDKLAAALGESWVESSVNLPAAFHLSFRMSAREMTENFAGLLRIGMKVTLYAVADKQGEDTPLITGLLTAIETERTDSVPKTVLRGFDHSFKMLRQRRATGYLNMTAAEIVTRLAGLDGVEVGTIEPTTPMYELMTQPNVPDWQFVKYLAGQAGMEADFDDEGRLRFRKPSPVAGLPITVDFEKDVRQCRTGVTASDQVSQVTSRGWNAELKTLLLGKAPAVSSTEYDIGTTPGETSAMFGLASLTETGTPYGTQAETDRAASSLAADVTSAFAEMEMEVDGWPGLTPGTTIVLENAGSMFDGTYTASATRHVFSDSNFYTTWVWVSGRQVRTLYGLAASGEAEPRVPGVVNAIVTDINDPANQGRVKLRFPWFDDTYVTDWVRTVQFGGFKGGGVISPEVDDEVLVAFDRGSMDYPYVLGGLYSNPENSPSEHDTPLYTGGVLNRRSLVSRTGHRLELLDAPAEQKTGVRLLSGDQGLTVFLNESQTTITISSNGAIDIKGQGPVRLSSSDQVAITAPAVGITGAVSIKGDTSIEGAVSIVGAFTETGVSTLTGDVNITGEVVVTGNENVIGVLTQDGMPVV